MHNEREDELRAGHPMLDRPRTPDLDAAVEFYGGLFGWSVPARENAEQTGGYRRRR